MRETTEHAVVANAHAHADAPARRFSRGRTAAPARIGVSLVVPAMNEARNIGAVLARIPEVVDEVILVDGDSVDDTVAISRAVRPDIRVIGQDRPGKGAALRAGFAAARGEVIVMIDADGSMDPEEIRGFVGLVREGFDLVKGSRFMSGGGTDDMELVRRLGNGALNGMVNTLYGSHFTDLCYGYVAFKRDRLDDLALTADGFEIETEIVVRALRARLKVVEVASFEAPRMFGESNLNTWRDGWRVLRTLLRHRFRTPAAAPATLSAPAGDLAPVIPIARAADPLTRLEQELRASRQPTVSVVICAYTEERWDDLVAAIASCREQTHSPLETIVVVDHNPALLARVRALIPKLRVIANTGERGLSGARNSGVQAAAGEVVAFLDDDAAAAPDWLEQLTRAYRDERVIGVGGLVEPRWPQSQRPATLPPEFDWVVGCSYLGLPDRAAPVRNMIGANMSLRRDVFAAIGGFSSEVGRVGTLPLGCEETELCIRARQHLPGAVILFEPGARVYHRVPLERTRWRYFRSRCFAEGLSKAAVAATAGARDGLASERAYALRTLPRGLARGLRDAITLRDIAGIVRSAGILVGLMLTTVGYTIGMLRRAR